MTLPEFLGSVFGVLGSIAGPIGAWSLGYGPWEALLAMVIGLFGGWIIGVALTGPVIRLQDRQACRKTHLP